jgi:Protein kinase domain
MTPILSTVQALAPPARQTVRVLHHSSCAPRKMKASQCHYSNNGNHSLQHKPHRKCHWPTVCFGVLVLGVSVLPQLLVSRRISSFPTAQTFSREEQQLLEFMPSSRSSRTSVSSSRDIESANSVSINKENDDDHVEAIASNNQRYEMATKRTAEIMESSNSVTSVSSHASAGLGQRQPRVVHWTLKYHDDTPYNVHHHHHHHTLVDRIARRHNRQGVSYPVVPIPPPPPPTLSPLGTDPPESGFSMDDESASSSTLTSRHTDDLRRWDEDCVPMASWQTTAFPVCNVLHEISVADRISTDNIDDDNDATNESFMSLLSTKGSWRTVWKLQQHYWPQPQTRSTMQRRRRLKHQHDSTTIPRVETVVVKLLKMHRDFNAQSYEQHRVDALAMERLTSSTNIVDVFGYCGQSVISEFASGNARLFVKNESISPLQRLVLGRDMARALADLHSIDFPNATNVTLTHNDLNMANLVEVQGRIKLNDFNIGVLQRWNVTDQSICRTPVRFAAPLWKSPEEIRNTSAILAAPTDVFGLGNLLFQVLTRRQPWTHLEPNGPLTSAEAAQRKLAGGQPFVPEKYRGNVAPDQQPTVTSVVHAALHEAVINSFQTLPQNRPTAHEIAQRLDAVVQYIAAQQQVFLERQRRKQSKLKASDKKDKKRKHSSRK